MGTEPTIDSGIENDGLELQEPVDTEVEPDSAQRSKAYKTTEFGQAGFLREAEQAIIESIIESSADCIVVVDKNYRHVYANQAALDHVKKTADQVIGKTMHDALAHLPNFDDTWIKRVQKVLKAGLAIRIEDEMEMHGALVFTESVVSPIKSPAGDVIAVCIVHREVTEHKLLLTRYKQNECSLKDVYDSVYLPLFSISLINGRFVECNRAFANLFGYDSKDVFFKELQSKGEEAFVDLKEKTAILERLNANQSVENFQVTFVRRSGSVGHAKVFFNHSSDQNDFASGVAIDITAETVLTKTEKKVLKHLLDGQCNKETARALCRSVRTIEDHRSNIMRKLGTSNVFELGKMCILFK